MRDIEFRFWNRGTMDYNPELFRGVAVDLNDQISVLQDTGTLEQYTGLKDKNGKKIFEGDIVSHGWIIKYSMGCFWVIDPTTSFTVDLLYVIRNEIKIIGNIHETPKENK